MHAKKSGCKVLRRVIAVLLTLLLCQVLPVLPLSAEAAKGDPSAITESAKELDMIRYGTGFE